MTMSETDIAKTVAKLDAIESIKCLKNKYFRALDQELFDEVASCFTDDGVIDYGPAGTYEKVSDFISMITEYAKTNTAKGIHQGYNPEVEVNGNTASGKWVCSYNSVDSGKGISYKQTGVYEDEYACVNGQWLIKRTNNRPLFNESAIVEGGSVNITLG